MGAGVPEGLERRAGRVDDVEDTAEVELRPMEAGDVPRVGSVERSSFSRPWKERTFRRLLEREGTELWVADAGKGGVVGYVVLWAVLDEAELGNIAVAEEHRGRGVGAALLDHALERARALGAASLFLEVRSSNRAASALYESRGFRVVAVRRDYYDSPTEDALVMLKSLR